MSYTSLHMTQPVLMDKLQVAYQELKDRENRSSQKEMATDLCHDMLAVAIHFGDAEWRVMVEFGFIHDLTVKCARIFEDGRGRYTLKWV